MSEPIMTYKIPGGYMFELYPNRIEYTKKTLISNKKEAVLFRNITSVEASNLGRTLNVELASGKIKKYPIGPKKAQEARGLILANL